MTQPRQKKRLPFAVRIIIILICVLVVLAGGALLYGNMLLDRITYASSARTPDPEDPPIIVTEEEPDPEIGLVLADEMTQTVLTPEEQAELELKAKLEGVRNVLLIGVDRRGTKGNSRSDTMLIATLDKNNNRLKLCSIMRDMYVPIPGRGEARINSACAYGGPDLLMQTINENFMLSIDKYVMVDFRMFEKIVDQLGGITIDMSAGEVAEANDCIAGLNKQRGAELTSGFITQRGGNVKLNGKQALGYARIRHFGNGDYARTSRQFKVLQAILSKFKQIDPIKQQQALYELLPMIETNLDKLEIVDLMVSALSIGTDSLMHYRLPVQDFYKARTIKGANVLLPDIAANAQRLHEFIYDMTEVGALEGSDTKKGTYHPKTTQLPEEEDGLMTPDPNAGIPLDPNAPTPVPPPGDVSPSPEPTPSPPTVFDLPVE